MSLSINLPAVPATPPTAQEANDLSSIGTSLYNAINQTTGTVPDGITNTAEETAPGGASNSNLVGW